VGEEGGTKSLPVKATLSTRGCLLSGSPASNPYPVTCLDYNQMIQEEITSYQIKYTLRQSNLVYDIGQFQSG